ncbi:helix-turn-helix domain-containing protein [Acrocarpospora macrocephala]|uniref:HTH cro/C1-type domain-containing protein n=1 Tax=Acrocarpospora macrocephala TaxID=150177 RepID=A0A5M3WIZ9_9ACTN|nr:helix-turn-helix transcriptional regulator [Acrocarpospora macrocephala]GES08656.1 hypothetical protein Amac_022520 [Acrocarpospora macrocephala]
MTDEGPHAGIALARRLRALREECWPGLRITQAQLCAAFGVSVPLISSWESARTPKIPPMERIKSYAAFFATERSMEGVTPRMLTLRELTDAERSEFDQLYTELKRLRVAALVGQGAVHASAEDKRATFSEGPWHFDDGMPITIICSQLPDSQRAKIPYADPNTPDYIDLYRYSDLDSLFELHGHLRAANPLSLVTLRSIEELNADDLTTHIVLLGGVDWNRITASFLDRLELPVRQVSDWAGEKGPYFEVAEVDGTRRYHATLDQDQTLLEDVAFFYRGPNVDNVQCTVSICNGMYARGVYGAVRALTDARFRERNSGYLRRRFAGADAYCMLMRVRVEGRIALTPDWTIDAARLHEWPESLDES